MNIQLEQSLGTMAIIADERTRTAEVLDVDRIAVISIVINALTGLAQFALAFGGVDSSGKFHLDPNRAAEAAHLTITRANQQDPAVFDKLFCDETGSPKCEYSKEFFYHLTKTMLLEGAYSQWGGKYPDMHIKLNGESALRAEKGCIVRPKSDDAGKS